MSYYSEWKMFKRELAENLDKEYLIYGKGKYKN